MIASFFRGVVNLNCERHPDRRIVGRCLECGKGVCPECVAETGEVLRCPECFKKEVERIRAMMGAGAKKAPRAKREKAPKPAKEKAPRRWGRKGKEEEEAPEAPPVVPPAAYQPPEYVEAPAMVVARPEEEIEELPVEPEPEPAEPSESVQAFEVEEQPSAEEAIRAIEAREVVPRLPADEVVFSAAPTADLSELVSEEAGAEGLAEAPVPTPITPAAKEMEKVESHAVEEAAPAAPALEVAEKERKRPRKVKGEKPPKEPKEKKGFFKRKKEAPGEYGAVPEIEAKVKEIPSPDRIEQPLPVEKPGFEEVPRVIAPQAAVHAEVEAPPVFEEPTVQEQAPTEKKRGFWRKKKEQVDEPGIAEEQFVFVPEEETAVVQVPEAPAMPPAGKEVETPVEVTEFGIPLKKKRGKALKESAPKEKKGFFRKKSKEEPVLEATPAFEEVPPSIAPPSEEPPVAEDVVSVYEAEAPPVWEAEAPPVWEGEEPPVAEPPEAHKEIEPPAFEEVPPSIAPPSEEPPVAEDVVSVYEAEAPPVWEEEKTDETGEPTSFYFEEEPPYRTLPADSGAESYEAGKSPTDGEITPRTIPPDETDFGWSFDEKPPSPGEVVPPSAGLGIREEPPEYGETPVESIESFKDAEGKTKGPDVDDELDSFFFEEEQGKEERGGREDKGSFWD